MQLLDVASLKFISSVAGISLSIILSFIQKAWLNRVNMQIHRFCSAVEKRTQLITTEQLLYQWLIAQGKQGFYCPDFVVGHVMQIERITPAYFRRWAAREGRDLAVCDRLAGKPAPFRQAWYWRHLVQSALRLAMPRGPAAERFRCE